ncbi:MAG: hypothetical protein ABEJ68_02265 [Halobacteriaceae archaeon]
MPDDHPLTAVSRAVAVLGATYLTVGSLSLARDPGATTARYALLLLIVALAWGGVAGVVREERPLWATSLVGLTVLALFNDILTQFLFPALGALALGVALTEAR